MTEQISHSVADYCVLAGTLLIPLGIGLWYAVKDVHKLTRDEYLLGGRQMSILPVALSTFITFVSAISLMGTPAETFYFGVIAVTAHAGVALSYTIGCFTLVPLLYPLRLTSVYEYLKLRYRSEAVHLMSTIIGLLSTLFYQAIVLFSPALALQAYAGLPFWVSIGLIGAIGTLYTSVGGFKSVIWTDVFQLALFFIAVFAIIIKACIELGGIGEVLKISYNGGRINFDKFSLDPRIRHTLLSLTIGSACTWTTNCLSQSTVQRISSLKTLRSARMVFIINIFINLFYGILIGFVGLSTYAYYSKHGCDVYEAKLITNRNQIVPYFVLHAMTDTPGMAGLYMGALCCGALSSLSSGINAMAANTIQDILERPLRHVGEATLTFITKMLVVFYGALAIGLAYLAKSMDGPVTQLAGSVFGAFGSPILGIIVMGASVPWANKYGALAGAASSLVINLWISLGGALHSPPLKPLEPISTENCFTSNSSFFQHEAFNESSKTHYSNSLEYYSLNTTIRSDIAPNTDYPETFFLYDITYEWFTVIGCIVCITVGLTVSFLTSLRLDDERNLYVVKGSTKAIYIFPFLQQFWGLRDKLQNVHAIDKDDFDTVESVELTENTKTRNKDTEMETSHPLL